MIVRPLHDRVMVERLPAKEASSIIAVVDDEKPTEGIVLAVGPGRKIKTGERIEMTVKPGDHVFFGKFGGTTVRLDGKDYLLMLEEEILAVGEIEIESEADRA